MFQAHGNECTSILLGHASGEHHLNSRTVRIEDYMASRIICAKGKARERAELHDLSITVTAGARNLSLAEYARVCEWIKRYALRAVVAYEFGDISEHAHVQAVATCKATSSTIVKSNLTTYVWGDNAPSGATICCKDLSQCEVHTFLGNPLLCL